MLELLLLVDTSDMVVDHSKQVGEIAIALFEFRQFLLEFLIAKTAYLVGKCFGFLQGMAQVVEVVRRYCLAIELLAEFLSIAAIIREKHLTDMLEGIHDLLLVLHNGFA